MRAIRFDGESVRVVANAADPALQPGEALVHPTRLLVGPTDAAAAAAGDRAGSRLIGVMGHQFVGVVKQVRPAEEGAGLRAMSAARQILLGKRVVGSPTVVCTNCDMCRAGLPSHCRARRVMGLHAREGCFADLFAIPLGNLLAVPDAVDDDRAVFAVMAASASQAGQMLRAAGKHYITIIGDNAAALMTAQLLARLNKSARLLYTRPERARLCERWGIKHRAVEEPGRRQDQDVVVECTGTPGGLRLAMQLVRPRGVILLKSSGVLTPCPSGQPFTESSAWRDRGVDLTPAVVNEVQVLGCRDASIADGLGAIADGLIDTTGLITRRFRMDDAPAALAAASGDDQLAVVMDV